MGHGGVAEAGVQAVEDRLIRDLAGQADVFGGEVAGRQAHQGAAPVRWHATAKNQDAATQYQMITSIKTLPKGPVMWIVFLFSIPGQCHEYRHFIFV